MDSFWGYTVVIGVLGLTGAIIAGVVLSIWLLAKIPKIKSLLMKMLEFICEHPAVQWGIILLLVIISVIEIIVFNS